MSPWHRHIHNTLHTKYDMFTVILIVWFMQGWGRVVWESHHRDQTKWRADVHQGDRRGARQLHLYGHQLNGLHQRLSHPPHCRYASLLPLCSLQSQSYLFLGFLESWGEGVFRGRLGRVKYFSKGICLFRMPKFSHKVKKKRRFFNISWNS